MRLLDNMAAKVRNSRRSGGRSVILWILIGAISTGISCRKGPAGPTDVLPQRPTKDAIAESEQLYAERADLVKVRQAVVALRQAQAEHPTDYELAWRLAKFNYYLGAHSPDAQEQEKAFRDGIEAGKLAIQLKPDKPDGHFWLGANYGGNAKISVLASLSDVEDIKQEMEIVLKLDQGYQGGSAYMALGQVYMEAPRLFGGDLQKAVAYLEKGIKVGPNNALLRVRLAQAYAEAGRNEDARREIDSLMKMKATPGYEPEYSEAVTEARKLQDQIK